MEIFCCRSLKRKQNGKDANKKKKNEPSSIISVSYKYYGTVNEPVCLYFFFLLLSCKQYN